MNYTTFFVALSALGVLVFVGIFGAAWMSAAEKEYSEERERNPVHSPTTQLPIHIPGSAPTTGPTESPSETTVAVTASTEQLLHSSYDRPVPLDDVPTTKPSLVQLPPARGVVGATEEPVAFVTTEDEEPSMEEDLDQSESNCTRTILTDEKGSLQPKYENEDSCQEWLVQYSEGYSVDILLDRLELDGASNDFLLLSADETTIMDEENPIFTWTITQKKNYRIPDRGTAFLLFVSHKSETIDKKPGGFRLKYSRYGNATESDQTTTISSVPTPPPNDKESIIVTIGAANFEEKEQAFKTALAGRANEFCRAENITLKNEVSYLNVYLSSQRPCIETWPDSDICFHLRLAIAVDNTNSKKYELTGAHLQKMWDEWNSKELEGINIKKMEEPNYKKHVIIWTLISILFIIGFSVCLLFLWQWQLRNSSTNEEEKARPSMPIEVPPLFDYFDTRLDDPEYLPYYDSLYGMGTETSTDDVKFSYGSLPPYNPPPIGSSTFHFGRPSNAGIDNQTFFLEEEEEEEYEIMNREKEVQKLESENEKKNDESQETNQ